MNVLLETPRLARDLVHVLLVEDSDGDARLVQLMLQGTFGHNIEMTRARSLSEALSLIDASFVDCAILDLGLPDAYGLEAVRALKEHSPLMPIVVLTGAADSELAVAALAAGAQDYLVKGNTIDESLTRSIRYAVVRKAGEDALVRSQHALAEAQRVARLGSWDLEFSTNAMHWSDEMCRLFACPTDVAPSFDDILGRLDPEERDVLEAHFRAAVAARSSFDVDYRIVLPDANTRWIRLQGRVEDSGTAPALWMHGTAQDITDELFARATLEDTIRAKDAFIASISHELRTPLTAVLGLAEVLRSGTVPIEDAGELIALLADQAQEVSLIVEDLLVAGRLESDTLTIHPSTFDLADETMKVIRPLSLTGNADLEVAFTAGAASAFADPLRVRQILRILITNARRHGLPPVTITASMSEGRCVVQVADRGDGIPRDAEVRLFEPYARFGPARGQPLSVGLGLYVGLRLARLMGGDLTYRRQEAGTIFELTLPGPQVVTDSHEGLGEISGRAE